MFYVYVLQNDAVESDFYIGFSGDLRRRFTEHNSGQVHATRGRKWRLIYYESYLTESAARERERVLKHDGRTRRYLMERLRQMLSEGG